MLRTGEAAPPSVLELLSRVQEDRVDFVNVEFTDIMGVFKGVTIASLPQGWAGCVDEHRG
jgi:glutamine synthetase